MLVFDFYEFTQNTKEIFDVALTDDVIINNNDGNSYKILPIKNNNRKERSPLEDIPYITADITTREIVELLREGRAGI
jgi:hypothetical protein